MQSLLNLDASVDMSSVGATNGSCGTTISDLNTSVDVTSRYGAAANTRAGSGKSASTRPAPYELSAVVGSGKYSTVYRATRIDTGEVIAVKKVQVFDMDSNTRSDCITEVKLLQVLDHPHVIKYMNSYIVDNELIIELEFAEGGDLGALIAERIKEGRPFEEETIWEYFVQVVDAAKHMHDNRTMHRDIKPSNIFITRSGILKLGDFGLSRHFSSQTKHACSAVGTPYYMSPEVIRGLPYDWSSDVWSLGCLLYELAKLHNPFFKDGLNFYQLGKNINNCQYDPLPPHLSEELRSLTSRMIQQDPQRRPTVHEVFDIATQCLERMRANSMQA
uniref:non-specific serine/threonine protein kinase n=1 Tax=Pyramimonas obovata TaxID=1411642 RepID=A0A7S0RPF9_9CHLO|mmetsp:Transcript_38687/g.84150  ORF Transcript_38687/g.84150 Transcript_38687/m.84150 type:complete len:332 (+) Transcript_38687:137-1132(+)|eukprot:CAMPEP_0118922086 /NCGR_PEP_ID=MMETSP1169-20130426/1139_1 /TAXON_ID=36882 /ORGANISM="Pyramimonas obovata, Strain CCMP722" /LENGTH=331 /DNA_ID=CAMNT_0006862907 /DNA_START=92 /DNA_END=1087 /DNA_ORIENTATION=-